MELKKYQQKCLEKLRAYLKETNKVGPSYAFIDATGEPYKKEFFGDIPFICLKVPTGGGKTLIACHALQEIIDTTLENKMERGLVLWFVPSEAIKTQTLRKLSDKKDFHRQILDEYFDNKVKVFSNTDALRIRKQDLDGNLCIVIATFDAFRKEEKLRNKYKVYQENGELLSHFEDVQDDSKLEKDELGTVINSLANVVRMNNPLIVIDEGHRTKTDLSIQFLKDLNPSFVIEYTATPRLESNVLVKVHSSELKEEKMVKIPIILESVAQWQQTVSRGVAKRNYLEDITKKETGEYIRPIALLQAEQEKESLDKITVDKLREQLIKEHRIPEEEIAVKTSSKNELEGVSLFSKQCKIRYIITVNALAEGWDCSFAYVLISVANIGAKISVEQIIGRIVRLPNAKEKKTEELNYSYIFASAKNFNEAANEVVSGLEKNGFSRYDVISSDAPEKKSPFEVHRVVKEDVNVPMIAFEGEALEFSDLIGEDFELSKQKAEFDFNPHYDSDGRIKIDVRGQDEWIRERQTTLHLVYKDKDFSEKELIAWLDKKLRFVMLDKKDKMKFIEKAISHQLKKHNLAELSVNRFVLRDRIDEVVWEILEEYTKKQFDSYVKSGKIKVKELEAFPEKIELTDRLNEKFKKNYYEDIDKLNKEELSFIQRLDTEHLSNIKFWIRNREKKDPFYLQGWKSNKFYPDFIAITKSGNFLALEWKGGDRISNEDTKYKEEVAKVWEILHRGKCYFFLVNNGNIEDVLTKVRSL